MVIPLDMRSILKKMHDQQMLAELKAMTGDNNVGPRKTLTQNYCDPLGITGPSARAINAAAQAHTQANARALSQTIAQTIAATNSIVRIPNTNGGLIDVMKEAVTIPHSIEVGEITGWRVWRECDGYLVSPDRGDVWAPGEEMEGKPSLTSLAGVNCYKKRGRAIAKAIAGYGRATIIVGQISIWGEVIEFEKGYRAEFAKVHSLDSIENKRWFGQSKLRRLQKLYGV